MLQKTLFMISNVSCFLIFIPTAAIAAVLTLQFLVHGVPEADQTLGHSFLNENLSPLQGFTFEFFLGFLLLFTICAVCDDKRPESRFTAPLVVGCSVLVGRLSIDAIRDQLLIVA